MKRVRGKASDNLTGGPGQDVAPAALAGPDTGVAERLAAIAIELQAIAARVNPDIANTSVELMTRASAPAEPRGTGPSGSLAKARELYEQRQRRKAFFNADLFSEPAWDMLLDLYISGSEGKQVSTTSACIGAGVPVATGIRWLHVLENEGLVVRRVDPADGRRTFVSLTTAAFRTMNRFLENGEGQGSVVALRSAAGF